MQEQTTIVVAGGSRGLGRQLVVEGLKRGYKVAALGRDQKALDALEKKADGQAYTGYVCDLTDAEQVGRTFNEIVDTFGQIGALVNNAGTWTGGKSIVDLSFDDLQQSMQLNFYAAFHATKAVLKCWQLNRDQQLAVVNIGATASLRGSANVAAFAVAKSSLRIFSQSLARELGPQGVHVAHIVIDGLLDNQRTRGLNPALQDEAFIKLEPAASTILDIASQDRSCWTFECDIRPFNETW